MISKIEGVVKLKGQRFVVVDVNGVGYRIFISEETLRHLPKTGEGVELWTHLHLREDTIELYGFLHYAELEFFEVLIQISGIGPKSGLAVLAVASLDVLKKAIAAADTSYLTKVSGIGHRLADKIILELKDKLVARGIETEAGVLREESEAFEALRSLGYSLGESREALRKVSKETKGTADIIKESLRNIHKK